MTTRRRSVLVVCRSAPYGSARSRDALELAMAFGAFDQAVAMLFLDDGVFTLLNRQNPSSKNVLKAIGALSTFGVSPLFACQEAIRGRGLSTSELIDEVQLVDGATIKSLVASHDLVLTV